MNQTTPRPAQTYAEAEEALLSRWPEHKLDPTLDRIRDFCSVLGDPQTTYDVLHITGTNGKTSTARMAERLLITMGLRTGRFTSPHLTSMTERIVLDGDQLTDEQFVDAFNDVAPYTHLVDAQHEHPLSFFETVVAMAYAAFSNAPVDVAVIEVGMGGAWDATNVADGKVAVIAPIGLDHAQYLGDSILDIAAEKVGIIKPGAVCVSAVQQDEVAALIAQRCAEVGATLLVEGVDFAVERRTPAVGGQMLDLRGVRGTY
ncbi:MAG TPA: Mur ligase family protein, partial [Marmoricola sp.]|nr:Mur ligase family protein [Marmoricola sp.]